MEVIAENYGKSTGGIVDVMGGGSGNGIRNALEGTTDIGMSSRELNDDEKQSLDGRFFVVAKDGIALIVHPDNPVSELTLEEIRKIYMREITNWSELTCPAGHPGPDRQIHVVTREEGSGTRGAFEELVMNKERIHSRTIVLNTNGGVRQFVTGNQNAIGYVSMNLAQPPSDDESDNQRNRMAPVQGVGIIEENENGDMTATPPTFARLADGSYDLYRPFVFITSVDLYDLSADAKNFLAYLYSDEAQTELANRGLVPYKDERILAVLGV
jgi:phosphate transport system substrate-binding protein